MNESFHYGSPVALKLRLGNDQDVLFMLDTACTTTTLDDSFEPSLGPPLGSVRVTLLEGATTAKAKVFAAPKLSLGDTRLMTGATIVTGKTTGNADCAYRGILGLDCLQHYCIQMDFEAGKVRFLAPQELKREELGKAYAMTGLGFAPQIDLDVSGLGTLRFVVDSGFWNEVDLTFTPAVMRMALQNRLVVATPLPGVFSCKTITLGGETYTNLYFREVPIQGVNLQGFIPLRFLARHVTTFDFPNRVLYLRRMSHRPGE